MKARLSYPFSRWRWLAAGWAAALASLAGGTGFAQSLWQSPQPRAMFADRRAAGVGDLITVVVQENNSTTKGNTTQTGKQSGLDASIATFLYSPAASGLMTHNGKMPAIKLDSKSSFNGGGTINNSEKIIARIAVRVTDALPNGNLLVEGTRDTAFAGEQQTMILRGVVRSEDILPNNTIYSYNVADATIRFTSKGTLTDAQRKGWLMKIWDKFAPF